MTLINTAIVYVSDFFLRDDKDKSRNKLQSRPGLRAYYSLTLYFAEIDSSFFHFLTQNRTSGFPSLPRRAAAVTTYTQEKGAHSKVMGRKGKTSSKLSSKQGYVHFPPYAYLLPLVILVRVVLGQPSAAVVESYALRRPDTRNGFTIVYMALIYSVKENPVPVCGCH